MLELNFNKCPNPFTYVGEEPLTEEKIDAILETLRPVISEFCQQRNERVLRTQEELNRLYKHLEELDIRKEELRQEKLEAHQKKLETRQKKEETLEKYDQLTEEEQSISARQFYSIFSKNSLSAEEFSRIFKTYLNENVLTFVEDEHGGGPQLNSMHAVTRFLADHPEIKTCDFRVFKDKVYGIPTLTEYLKQYSIRAVAFKNFIPQEAKDSLATAVAARRGGLKIQYFT